MTSLLEDWWSKCESGVLLFRLCPNCKSRTFQPRLHCSECGSEMAWSESCGSGTVQSVTRVHKSSVTAAGMGAPYTIGYVWLDESFSMMSTFIGDAKIGDRVNVDFVRVGKRMVPVCKRATVTTS